MQLNLVDVALALIVLLGAWSGFRRGFLFSALDLLTLAVSLVAAFLGYRYPAAWIERLLPEQHVVWAAPAAFVLTFLLVHFVLGLVTMAIARATPRAVHANVINRVLGLAPGTVNGIIHAIVTAVVLVTVPLGAVTTWARDSTLAAHLSAPAEWVEVQLAPIFDPAIRRTMQAITVDPESKRSITLRAKVTQPRVRTDLEARMLEMLNEERRRAGLRPLKADPELAEVARAHSRDMFARGYFSHVTPDGRDLSERMRAAREGYLVAGENLALAPTLPGAHQGLMNSPGHRKNILRAQFGRVGIGILDGGVHGLMVTQNFRN
jgi:uncharacterized protein YkwD